MRAFKLYSVFCRSPYPSSPNGVPTKTSDEPPLVRCWRDRDLAVFWCEECECYHRHGVEPDENLTHRVAHCDDVLKNYPSGYVLDICLGKLPREIEKDMRRARPKGPEVLA